ncbi:CLUMA_CG009641, isoform A [Clunio marinus]|uniref:CLUMA_CG009641, isoform A n=1 Tax=Clunio marinus TaxID=568069 RepID=A0A1J1I7F3_9DIPT|nr:CLUMA_CG009641, isoform A [Clunio marinus]
MLKLIKVFRPLGSNQKSVYGDTTHRMLSMFDINENLYLCTDKPRSIEFDKKTLSWFYGQRRHINKYSKLYTDQGMDVLVVRINLIQSLFDLKGVEKFGQDIADVLNSNEKYYKEIFIHSFSAGCGMYGVAQRMIKKNLDKYGNVPKRVIGQIWDSISHHKMTIEAVPLALFPNNIFMHSIVKGLLWCHLTFYFPLKPHYEDCYDNFYNNLARAPALIMASKADVLGKVEFAEEVVRRWRTNGVNVTYHCFDDSAHLKHMQKYPKEYLKLVYDHWELIQLKLGELDETSDYFCQV